MSATRRIGRAGAGSDRRAVALGLIAAGAVAAAGPASARSRPAPPAPASSGPTTAGLGSPRARVTLLEYGSLTCGHCAAFHTRVLPAIKARYVDTGRVRYVFRAFPTPPVEFAAALHAVADCAPTTAGRYALVAGLMEAQPAIFAAAQAEGGARAAIFETAARAGGLTPAAIETCLADPVRRARIVADARAGEAAGVVGTPTLFVGADLLETPIGGHTIESVSAALDAALAAAGRAPARKARRGAP